MKSSLQAVSEFHGLYKTLRVETIVSRSVTMRVYHTALLWGGGGGGGDWVGY